MDVDIRDLNPRQVTVISKSRGTMKQVHERLRDIVDEGHRNPSTLGKLRAVVTFNLDQGEKGKASKLKSNLTKRYGTNATYAGFRFVIVRSAEGDEEYLAVIYEPKKIVPGKFERREAERKRKYEERYARKKRR